MEVEFYARITVMDREKVDGALKTLFEKVIRPGYEVKRLHATPIEGGWYKVEVMGRTNLEKAISLFTSLARAGWNVAIGTNLSEGDYWEDD